MGIFWRNAPAGHNVGKASCNVVLLEQSSPSINEMKDTTMFDWLFNLFSTTTSSAHGHETGGSVFDNNSAQACNLDGTPMCGGLDLYGRVYGDVSTPHSNDGHDTFSSLSNTDTFCSHSTSDLFSSMSTNDSSSSWFSGDSFSSCSSSTGDFGDW